MRGSPCADGEGKPVIPFACLIALAIHSAPVPAMTVSELYTWIQANVAYFGSPAAGVSWKNSVRHNLSLNKYFTSEARRPGAAGAKSSLWTVRPDAIPAIQVSHALPRGYGSLLWPPCE